jgi:hypothetical protein
LTPICLIRSFFSYIIIIIIIQELTALALSIDPKDGRAAPPAIGVLIRHNLVSAQDTNAFICRLLADVKQSPSVQTATDLKWSVAVLKYVIIPTANSNATANTPADRSNKQPLKDLASSLEFLNTFQQPHPMFDFASQAYLELAQLVAAALAVDLDPSVPQLPHQAASAGSVLPPSISGQATLSADQHLAAATLDLGVTAVSSDPPAFREKAIMILEEWVRALSPQQQSIQAAGNTAGIAVINRLQQEGYLKGDESTDRFFRICMVYCINQSKSKQTVPAGSSEALAYTYIDAFSKLVVMLFRLASSPTANSTVVPPMSKPALMVKALSVLCLVLVNDCETSAMKLRFDQRPYHRFMANWLTELNSPQVLQDTPSTTLFAVLTAFANMLHSLQPSNFASFAFAWMELISHRLFMPRLLAVKPQGWPLFHRLLVDLFKVWGFHSQFQFDLVFLQVLTFFHFYDF